MAAIYSTQGGTRHFDVHSLVRHGRLAEAKSVLESGEADALATDASGNSLLCVAAQNNNKRAAKLALRHGGAELLHMANRKGNTPLHFCYLFGFDAGLGAYLESKGANRAARNACGLTPPELAGMSAAELAVLEAAIPADDTFAFATQPGVVQQQQQQEQQHVSGVERRLEIAQQLPLDRLDLHTQAQAGAQQAPPRSRDDAATADFYELQNGQLSARSAKDAVTRDAVTGLVQEVLSSPRGTKGAPPRQSGEHSFTLTRGGKPLMAESSPIKATQRGGGATSLGETLADGADDPLKQLLAQRKATQTPPGPHIGDDQFYGADFGPGPLSRLPEGSR